MSGPERALEKLLIKNNYELVEANGFGVKTYRLPGCRDVVLRPGASAKVCAALTESVKSDLRRHDPENTPEAHRAQVAWEAEERARRAREQADRDLIRDKRLGGLSAVLTEPEVDAVVTRAEQILAQQREYQRLVRNRINA